MSENLQDNIKLFIATIVTISMILLSWNFLYNLGCFALLFPLIVLIVVSSSFIDVKMNERICFKNCYFQEKSIFSKILASSFGVVIFYFILSIVFTFSIMYGIISFPYQIWLYLVVHIILVILIYKQVIKLLKNTIQDKYLDIFSREWTINISSILLFIAYGYVFYNGYEPDYLANDLMQTIKNASNSISSNCLLIDYFLRLNTELDGTFWWIVTSSSETFDNKTVKSVIWISFILINSIAVLGINRFIVQVVYILDKIFSRKVIEEHR